MAKEQLKNTREDSMNTLRILSVATIFSLALLPAHIRAQSIGTIQAQEINSPTGVIKLDSSLQIRGNISGTGALTISAGGADQNIAIAPSGTGASVVTNLQDKGGQVYNVKSYGAIGNGTTDDTAGVAGAITAASGKGTVLFAPGRYRITALSIPSNTALECSSTKYPGRAFSSAYVGSKPTSGAPCVISIASNLTLSDAWGLTLNGITFDFGSSGSLTLRDIVASNFFDLTLLNAGDNGTPALLLKAVSTASSNNTAQNHFYRTKIQCNTEKGHYCHAGVQLKGSGTVNNQSGGHGVTDNWFYDTMISGNILYGVDAELNTDTNHFFGADLFQSGTVPGSAMIAINHDKPSSDQDADDETFDGFASTGKFQNQIAVGNCFGESIMNMMAASSFPPSIAFFKGATEAHMLITTTALFGNTPPSIYLMGTNIRMTTSDNSGPFDLIANNHKLAIGAPAIQLNGTSGPLIKMAAGAPSGPCTTGSLYLRTDGGTGTTEYVCENMTWVAK